MTELARSPERELAVSQEGVGRPLGMRIQPELRLSMGYQDPSRGNAPVKTDHFVVRNRDDVPDLAEKFTARFGEEPKEIPIMLPGTLGQAIDIRHVAFGGGGAGGGGALKAIGQTNFALIGTLGGGDVITTWNDETGEVDERNISGVDDELAKQLGIELRMTLRFMLPQVLGVGAFVSIDSKGKQSIDSLWQKLVELYGIFGPRVTFAVEPVLKLRPAGSRYYDEKKHKWRTSNFFALDIVVPESFEEMFARLQERNELLAGDRKELPAGEAGATAGPGSDGDGSKTPEPSPSAPSPAPPADPSPAAPGPDEEHVDETDVVYEDGLVREGQQTDLLGSDPPTEAQWAQFKAIVAEHKEFGGAPPTLEVMDEAASPPQPKTLTFQGDHRWEDYGKAYILVHFGVGSTAGLNSAQMKALIDHLDEIRIPF